MRIYSYAREQKAIAEGIFRQNKKYQFKWVSPCPHEWLKLASSETRTYFAIVLGMLAQLAVTLTLFFGSRKFHESYGFFSEHVNAGQCRHGYEW
jgi:hypothetical protein